MNVIMSVSNINISASYFVGLAFGFLDWSNIGKNYIVPITVQDFRSTVCFIELIFFVLLRSTGIIVAIDRLAIAVLDYFQMII